MKLLFSTPSDLFTFLRCRHTFGGEEGFARKHRCRLDMRCAIDSVPGGQGGEGKTGGKYDGKSNINQARDYENAR